MRDGLLNSRQLREALNLSPATFFRRKAEGAFRHLEVSRPVGTFRYSADKVRTFLAGHSTVQLGRRAS